MALVDIEHLVVVMFENRSFDNLLGWLYDNDTNPPKFNIPAQTQPTFDGLKPNTYFNQLNPSSSEKVFASRPTTAWPSCPNANQVPNPDPHEEFEHVKFQLFGTSSPAPDAKADMNGFLGNYSTTGAGLTSANQIMQTYGPEDANVINDIARNFAVCDAWFASVPSQTWPNRGFVHTGSSDGHINNDHYEWYSTTTIFNILQNQQKGWRIFYDTQVSCLTYIQLAAIGGLRDHVHRYSDFTDRCAAAANANAEDKLPAYSFIEPAFLSEFLGLKQPSDYHPPHNVCRGERFLADVYQAVRNSPYRDKIMLVILFDEHGGCYDHVPPPTGAIAPLPWPVSRDGSFCFDRFGVRVPAVVVSSYVEPGTVFRASPGEMPYDHTSILATLRDWLRLDSNPGTFLPSPRIATAPTLERVLTRARGNENTNWPEIVAKCTIDRNDESPNTPLNDVQKSLLAAAKAENTDTNAVIAAHQAKRLQTYEHGASFLQPDASQHEC